MEYLPTRLPRKPHVEHDYVVLFGDCPGLAIVAIRDEINAPALFLKAPFDELSDGRIVFDYEDFHRAGWTSSGAVDFIGGLDFVR